MDYLTSWDDRFGPEGGREIVMRFLENAGTWRGRDAQRLKAELRAAIGMKVAA